MDEILVDCLPISFFVFILFYEVDKLYYKYRNYS
jgi:hypothetical protein